eukprot:1183182-Amphidinium_carterae.1
MDSCSRSVETINIVDLQDVHQWISNFFNSTYNGTEDDYGTTGGVNNEDEEHNEYYMIVFNKWMKGKGKW